MGWGDEWVAVTVDGDLFNGYYRKDLFEAPGNRAAFRERYGYELAAPDTWRQYRDIAEFFTGRKDPDGKPLYGSSEAFRRGGQQFWDFFSRASAYTNHPEHPGAQFFDPDTMRAQINNPGWVRALEDYVEILRFAPPKAREFDIIEARNSFIVRAESTMALDWGDTGQIAADQADSKIKDKLGYFVLPGSHEVWNYKRARWDHFELPHKAPFLAFGGWVASGVSSLTNLFGRRTARSITRDVDALFKETEGEELRRRFKALQPALRGRISDLTETAIKDMGYALEIKANGNQLLSILATVAEVNDADHITELENTYRTVASRFNDAVVLFQ